MPSLNHSEETLTNKIVKKWFWLYFFWYLSAPLRYIIRVIIANSPDVSPSDFWVLYSIISLITFLYTYNDLWLTESLQYFLPRFYLRKQFNNIKTTIYISLLIQIFTWIIIASVLWFWSDWLAIHYFKSEIASTILKYFCFYFFVMNILQVIQTIFLSFQKTFESQCIEFTKALWITLFTISFFFLGFWDIEHYSISRVWWIAIAVIIAILLYLKYHKNIMWWNFKIDYEILKKYTKYSLWALIWNSIRNLFWQIILQMVVFFLWSKNAWYYSNFLSLYSIGITILWPIRSLLYPLTSEYKEESNTQSINNLITLFYNYFSIITLSFSTLFISLGQEISIVIFWEKYLISWTLLSYTWCFLIFNLLASFNYQILAWLWKIKERVYITMISCFLTIILWFIGIKIYGIYWAWMAFWIGNLANRALSFYLIKKENYKIHLNKKLIIKNIIFFIILWIIIILLKQNIIPVTWNRLNIIIHLLKIFIIFYSIVVIINCNQIKKCWNYYKNHN